MLLVVLAILLGAFARPADPAPTPGPAVDAERHAFYGIYLMGRKVGWAEEHLGPVGSGTGRQLENRMQAHVGVKRSGVSLAMEMAVTRRYEASAPHALLSLDETVDGLGSHLRFRGARASGTFSLETDTGRGWQAVPLAEPPAETWLDVTPGLAHPDPRVGDVVTTRRFDAQLARNVEASTLVVSIADALLGGRPQAVIELKSTEASTGLVLTSRLLRDGTVLEGGLGGQLRLAREEEATAKDPEREALDLYARSTVPAKGSLPADPRALSRVTYRVCGADPARLAGPWQTVQSVEGGCALVQVRRATKTRARDLPEADRARWLASDARVTATEPAVKKAARAAAGKGTAPDLVALVAWVHDHVRYALDFNPFNAAQVLSEGRGDCSEGALLLVAMARSLGLPAREVYGLVLASSAPLGFGYHAWAEVAVDDAWLPVDPTWNEAPVNPTHLRFDGEGPYGVLSVFGQVTLEVVEAE